MTKNPEFDNLPEGHYIRVMESALGIYPWVQLRKKNKWFFDDVVDEIWTNVKFPTVLDEIEYLGETLIQRYWENHRIRVTERIEGDFE